MIMRMTRLWFFAGICILRISSGKTSYLRYGAFQSDDASNKKTAEKRKIPKGENYFIDGDSYHGTGYSFF